MNQHTQDTLALLAMLEENEGECLLDDLIDDEDFENPYQEAYNEFLDKIKDL